MYVPRSGAIRKITYALPIYYEEDIPEESREEVFNLAKAFADEGEAENSVNVMPKLKPIQKVDNCSEISSKQNEEEERKESPAKECGPANIPVAEFTLIPDEEYNKLYPEIALLPFSVKSCADPQNETGSDGLEWDAESAYDMDSDDEEWLNDHRDYNITPNRLEYIFTQLNKRDTHIMRHALAALRPPYHEDFHKIFPYWKEKRLQNRNVSTWKPKQYSQRDSKMHGYVDPFLAFCAKAPRRPLVTSSHTSLKTPRKKEDEIESILDRALHMKEKLLNFKVWAHEMANMAEHSRDLLVQSFNEIKISHRRSEEEDTPELTTVLVEVDNNNNPGPTRKRKRISKPRRGKAKTKYSTQRKLVLEKKGSFGNANMPSSKSCSYIKALSYDEVISGNWRSRWKKNYVKKNI